VIQFVETTGENIKNKTDIGTGVHKKFFIRNSKGATGDSNEVKKTDFIVSKYRTKLEYVTPWS